MAALEPDLCILDETDSGLDIDALKIVANGVNSLRDGKRAFIIVTHYQRILTTSSRITYTCCPRGASSNPAISRW